MRLNSGRWKVRQSRRQQKAPDGNQAHDKIIKEIITRKEQKWK
ncbi:TPA: hypothetical protein ACL3HJ_001453 [Streptococcus pneumoniae]